MKGAIIDLFIFMWALGFLCGAAAMWLWGPK